MNRYLYLAIFSIFLFSGCTKSSRPDDLPPLFPCTITVTQDGANLADALVELVPQDSIPYSPSSMTDSDGDAVLKTYGFSGAPAGKYKIVVRKTIEDDIVHGTDEYGNQAVVSSTRYNLVEDTYTQAKQTPHEIEVASNSKGTKLTIDVGKAIREAIK